MNKSRKQFWEISTLIFISFTPLISIFIKLIILFILFSINLRYLNLYKSTKSILFITIITLFMFGFFLDLENINTINQFSPLNIYFPFTFFLGYILSNKYSSDNFTIITEKIIFITALFSLIGVLSYLFIPSLLNYLPSYTYYHTSHKTALIFNILFVDGTIVRRNCGIASEPGVFQFLLNIGLYSYLRKSSSPNLYRLIVYAAAIIFTKSTAGLIILFAITLFYLRTYKNLLFYIPIFILIFYNSILTEYSYQLNNKLIGSYAFQSRLDPMLNAYSIGLSTFWGLGNSGYNLNLEKMNIGSYDSYSQILVRYGYPMFIVLILFMLKMIRKDFILFLILFITFWGQMIWFIPFVTMLFFLNSKKSSNENSLVGQCPNT